MTAIEALSYCMGLVADKLEDGGYHSRPVYDRNGDPHWLVWYTPAKLDPAWVTPTLASGSPNPFVKALEPYSTSPPAYRQVA